MKLSRHTCLAEKCVHINMQNWASTKVLHVQVALWQTVNRGFVHRRASFAACWDQGEQETPADYTCASACIYVDSMLRLRALL